MNTGSVGELGEGIATRYLESKGYKIRERNYRKKWGEIDVVAQYKNVVHFVEVKTVSREKMHKRKNLSRATDMYRPEENVHPKKLNRLHRAIQSYLAEHKLEDTDWQLDVLAVELNQNSKKAHCRFIENVF